MNDKEKANRVGDITRNHFMNVIKPLNKKKEKARTRAEKNAANEELDKAKKDWWDEVKHLFAK